MDSLALGGSPVFKAFLCKWADGDDDGDGVVESLNFDREGEFDDKV